MQGKKQSKQEIKVVLGFAFGDEGKGNTVQWLCKQAIAEGKKPLVIRFSGGAQAGHRVIHNGISHICSSYGSGVLLGVPTLWLAENTFIDPCAIELERQALIKETSKDPGYPYIINNFPYPRKVHPYDMLSNRSDEKTIKDGSCGKGIYACFKRFQSDNASPIEFYSDIHDDELCKLYKEADRKVTRWNNEHFIDINDYDTLIFEGSQGLLLDMDNGFMPHCTPSHTGLNGIPNKYLTSNTEVYLVTRAYLTRHGNGYEPDLEFIVKKAFNLDEPTNVDTGCQGRFKRGVLDIDLLNRAIDRHHLDNYPCKFNVVINHLNTLKGTTIPYKHKTYFHTMYASMIGPHLKEWLNLNIQNVYKLDINSEEI